MTKAKLENAIEYLEAEFPEASIVLILSTGEQKLIYASNLSLEEAYVMVEFVRIQLKLQTTPPSTRMQ